MDSIDVRDLPEDQAQLVAAFVEFIRRRLREAREPNDAEAQERDWCEGSAMSFAKDLENDEHAIYDNWRQHYHAGSAGV